LIGEPKLAIVFDKFSLDFFGFFEKLCLDFTTYVVGLYLKVIGLLLGGFDDVKELGVT
jgi:hypothetical protein